MFLLRKVKHVFASLLCVGVIKVGDELEVVGLKPTTFKTTATGVEMFKKSMDQGQAGDNVSGTTFIVIVSCSNRLCSLLL